MAGRQAVQHTFSRTLLLACGALAVAGCNAGSISARIGGSDLSTEQLSLNGKGVVLVHTSLHDDGCHSIEAVLARPDGSGRWVSTSSSAYLKGGFDLDKVPGQVALPAGEYGIVGLRCSQPYRNRSYFARAAQRGSILDGSGAVYDKPIATFAVAAGEVSDLGSLRLGTARLGSAGPFGSNGSFVAAVSPTPEPWLQNLAQSNPGLYGARIARPMVVPAG